MTLAVRGLGLVQQYKFFRKVVVQSKLTECFGKEWRQMASTVQQAWPQKQKCKSRSQLCAACNNSQWRHATSSENAEPMFAEMSGSSMIRIAKRGLDEIQRGTVFCDVENGLELISSYLV